MTTTSSSTAPPLALSLPTSNRFVGLDVSKRSIMVAAVGLKQQVVLQPKKLDITHFENWAKQNLLATDAVVLEATSSAWYLYESIQK